MNLPEESVIPADLSSEQLTVMMLEGAHRFLSEMIQAIEAEDQGEKIRTFCRVLPLLEALMKTLVVGQGHVSMNLARIYIWWGEEIQVCAEIDDTARLRRVAPMMLNIRDGWAHHLGQKTA